MRILLFSYRERHGLAGGDEEVTEVEFSPEVEQYMAGKEHFVNIRMGNKIARVKADELKRVVDISV